jgi:hypothetical protein
MSAITSIDTAINGHDKMWMARRIESCLSIPYTTPPLPRTPLRSQPKLGEFLTGEFVLARSRQLLNYKGVMNAETA